MKKILVFGASNSIHSINKKLAHFAAAQLEDVDYQLIDLNDFDMPIFGVDREKRDGIPEPAQRFRSLIAESDGVLISFAEHNGSYSAVFKNLMDWASRIEGDLWQGKNLFFMASSPGGRGGKSVLETAISRARFMGGNVVAEFSLPFFNTNFDMGKGIIEPGLKGEFEKQLSVFRNTIL